MLPHREWLATSTTGREIFLPICWWFAPCITLRSSWQKRAQTGCSGTSSGAAPPAQVPSGRTLSVLSLGIRSETTGTVESRRSVAVWSHSGQDLPKTGKKQETKSLFFVAVPALFFYGIVVESRLSGIHRSPEQTATERICMTRVALSLKALFI